jgi:hypothetical protein
MHQDYSPKTFEEMVAELKETCDWNDRMKVIVESLRKKSTRGDTPDMNYIRDVLSTDEKARGIHSTLVGDTRKSFLQCAQEVVTFL